MIMINIPEKSKLTLYCFTVQSGERFIQVFEDFKVVAAPNEAKAFEQVKKHYPPGVLIAIKKQGSFKLEELIRISERAAKEEPRATEKENITKENFIFSIMFAIDEFVESEEDKTLLKNILNRIK